MLCLKTNIKEPIFFWCLCQLNSFICKKHKYVRISDFLYVIRTSACCILSNEGFQRNSKKYSIDNDYLRNTAVYFDSLIIIFNLKSTMCGMGALRRWPCVFDCVKWNIFTYPSKPHSTSFLSSKQCLSDI